ncbi:MAG: M1 family metallopeptidase [Gammaproteobacteria bacterium]
MPLRSTRSVLLKAVAAAALLAAAAGLLAQSSQFLENDVRVYPIPKPDFDNGIPFAPAHGAAVATPSGPQAWGGPRTGSEPTLSDRVANYQIEATLDADKHIVSGREKLTWRNRSNETVRSVYLHLYMNAFEHANTTFFTEERRAGLPPPSSRDKPGEQWGYTDMTSVRQGAAKVGWTYVHPDGGPENDHTVVKLDLPDAVEPGTSTTLDIDFATQLPRVYARSGYYGSFHLVAHWFPKIGVLELAGERGALEPRWNVHEFHSDSEFYSDYGLYDVKLTVPQGYTVGATGELQGAPVTANGMVTHHYVQGDVHDFAWTADQRSAPPLTATWQGYGSAPVAIRVLYPPEMASAARRALKLTQDSLAYFSRTLGRYPYKTVTVVLPPYNAAGAGSMEYPTFFTTMGMNEVADKSQDMFDFDFVTIHEFGHGYFYGILGSNEFEEPMLDEGLNEFWNHRMLAERGERIHPVPAWMSRLGLAPGFPSFELTRMLTHREEPADPPGQNAYDRLQGIAPVYDRTALVLRDLEARIGKDALERGFRTYYQRWKFRHPSVADLRDALAEGSGQRAVVDSVFAQQVYGTAKIDDRIAGFTSVEEVPRPGTLLANGKRVIEDDSAVRQRIERLRAEWKKAHPQAAAGTGPFPFHTRVSVRRRGAAVPQTLVVRFADGSVEQARFDPGPGMSERWQTFSWTRPAPAVSADLDPGRLHYLDVNKLDDSRTLAPDPRASRRWSAAWAAFVNLFFSLLATV